jgi:hypothetical protein
MTKRQQLFPPCRCKVQGKAEVNSHSCLDFETQFNEWIATRLVNNQVSFTQKSTAHYLGSVKKNEKSLIKIISQQIV